MSLYMYIAVDCIGTQATHLGCPASALPITFDLGAVHLYSTISCSPSETLLPLGRIAEIDKRPEPIDELEQSSTSSHILTSVKSFPQAHLRRAVSDDDSRAWIYSWHMRVLVLQSLRRLKTFPQATHADCKVGSRSLSQRYHQ